MSHWSRADWHRMESKAQQCRPVQCKADIEEQSCLLGKGLAQGCLTYQSQYLSESLSSLGFYAYFPPNHTPCFSSYLPGSSHSVSCERLPPLRHTPVINVVMSLASIPDSVFAIYTLPKRDVIPSHCFKHHNMLRTPKFLSPAQTFLSALDFQTQPSKGNQTFPSGCIIDISSWTHPKEDLLSFHIKCVPSCLLISICYHYTPNCSRPKPKSYLFSSSVMGTAS